MHRFDGREWVYIILGAAVLVLGLLLSAS